MKLLHTNETNLQYRKSFQFNVFKRKNYSHKPKEKNMTTVSEILAQSLKNTVSINDLNYILLKRKDGRRIPTLHPRDSFTIFAMLDKFLGGDGLSDEKSQFWEGESATSPITDDQKFEEMLISVSPMPENRQEKWTIIVFCETFFCYYSPILAGSTHEKFNYVFR
jgi:hypothetical protein